MKTITQTIPLAAIALVAAFSMLIAPFSAMAANLDVDTAYAGITTNNVVQVTGDSAPGFADSSFASDGTGKTDIYFDPVQLFGKAVTLGEIESISYWTKKDTLHTVEAADWYVTIYTKPYAGDVSSATWYGDRIGTEPYFSENLNAPVDQWNEWSTDGTTNTLRFFESTQGALGANFGSYTDPTWDTFLSGNALSGSPYSTRELQSISLQTGSAWAEGFEGQLDGLTITLTDNTVATVNFEEVPPPFVASLEITSPGVGATVSGVVNFGAVYTDEDGNDALQWAVRAGSCTTGTVAGNVDGFTTPFTWDSETFSASVDMTSLTPGSYCLVVNPTEDSGDTDLRATRNFTLEAVVVTPTDPAEKNQCKSGGWEDFGFKNQGQCVKFVETGKDSR